MTRSIFASLALAAAILCMAGLIYANDFQTIDGRILLQHIKTLSSDRFEGRAPGTEGENLSVAYIENQFRNLGLKPGNTDGTYIQKVPMVGLTPDPGMTLTLRKGDTVTRLKYLTDFVAWTRRLVPEMNLRDSPRLFVGYGVQAPEFNWDDYKGVDVRGKTLVMLINDPQVPDPADPAKLDPRVFGGDAMTCYGRWTYKYDIAAEKGAAGVIIVHETGPAGYPWSVVEGFGGERSDLVSSDKNMSKSEVEAWITLDQAKQLFAVAGQDFDSLKKQAVSRSFRPVPLDVTASVNFHNAIRTIASRNVLAKIEGSEPKRKSEYVVYTAHWDHLGVGQPVNRDRIYHGAVDNASGVAGLIEMARGFKRLPKPPKRSILFISATGKEQGLLGSEYYAQHPIHPLAKTVAEINMDGLNVYGRTKDITIVGLGHSDLDDYARRAAERQGRALAPDPEPEKGFNRQSRIANRKRVFIRLSDPVPCAR